MAPFEFCLDFRQQKTRVPRLSRAVVCVILRLAVSVEHRLVTDRQTDTRRQLIPALASVARVKKTHAFKDLQTLTVWLLQNTVSFSVFFAVLAV